MKIAEEVLAPSNLTAATRFKCQEGRWYKYHRIFILKMPDGHVAAVSFNFFERVAKTLFGEKCFFNLYQKLKSAKILKLNAPEKWGVAVSDNKQNEAKKPDNSLLAETILPKEIWQMSLEYLDLKDLAQAKQVSKTFLEAASKTENGEKQSLIEKEIKLTIEALRPFIFIDEDESRKEFRQHGEINNRYFHLYYTPEGKLLGFSKKNLRIYKRKEDNTFEKLDGTLGGYEPKNSPFEKVPHVELWLFWDNDSSYLRNNKRYSIEDGEDLEKKFPVHRLLERALFHLGSKFVAGLRELSKENSLYAEEVLMDSAKFPDSEIWKKGKNGTIPNYRITDEYYEESKKFGEPSKEIHSKISNERYRKMLDTYKMFLQ